MRVVANDHVVLADLESPHVGFENIAAGEGLPVVRAVLDDVVDAELLGRLGQPLIAVLLVSHVPPGAQDAKLWFV